MKHLDTSANVGLDFMENDVKVSFNDLFTKKVSFFYLYSSLLPKITAPL